MRSKLIAVLNLLADELQAHAAARALATIAKNNNKLIADYIIEALQIPDAPEPPKAAPVEREGQGVWIYGRLVAQSPKAVLIEARGHEDEDALWFPLSQCKMRNAPDGLQIWVPTWLIKAKNIEGWISGFHDVGT